MVTVTDSAIWVAISQVKWLPACLTILLWTFLEIGDVIEQEI